MKGNKNKPDSKYNYDFSGKNPHNAGKKRKSKQKKYRIPQKEKIPASIIVLYIAIAIIILAICAAVFLVSFNNEKAKQSGTVSNPGLITSRDSSSKDENMSAESSTTMESSEPISSEDSSESDPSSYTEEISTEEISGEDNNEPDFSSYVEETSDDTVDATTPLPEYDSNFFNDTLFIGDSIYTGLYLYGFIPMDNVAASVGYTPYKACTESFDGKGVTAVEYASQLSPKKIVIMLGSNEMAGGGDTAAIVESYRELISELNQVCPDSTICVVSVPPVTADSSLAADSNISNSVIDIFNGFLSEYCQDNGILYFDLNSLLRDENGYFSEEYAEADGLHFLSGAYKVMLSGLESIFDDTVN